jgi:hypothetical protein
MNDATPMEGGSVIIGEQNIAQDGLTFIQELLTTVNFNNDEDQASNSEEVEWKDDASEVQSKMIFMGHQISSCHIPVVRSFFIL